jgi:hypothetical protein
MTAAATLLTLGQVADRLGCQLWHVQRAIDRGFAPPPGLVGRWRVYSEADLPTLRMALALAGYLSLDAALEQTARDGKAPGAA